MAQFDFPLETLQSYKPALEIPDDFDQFWQETLSEARQYPLNARFEAMSNVLKTLEAYDVTFSGFGGQSIKGWFLLPKQRSEPLPCVVEFIGYGGGRSFPTDWLLWPSSGFAFFVMDTRGQGSVWQKGDTADITQWRKSFRSRFYDSGHS